MKKTKFALLALAIILVFSMSACVPTDDKNGNEASTQVSDVPAIAQESEEDQNTDEIPGMEDEDEPMEDEDEPDSPVT